MDDRIDAPDYRKVVDEMFSIEHDRYMTDKACKWDYILAVAKRHARPGREPSPTVSETESVPPVPEGWYQVTNGVEVVEGDKYCHPPHYDIWYQCTSSSIGRKTPIEGLMVIRKKQKPLPESLIETGRREQGIRSADEQDRIEVNDIVCVNFNGSQCTLSTRAVVKYVPVATGDAWIFKDTFTGSLHYVTEGCTITLVEKRGTP